jgi:hypothetical protein
LAVRTTDWKVEGVIAGGLDSSVQTGGAVAVDVIFTVVVATLLVWPSASVAVTVYSVSIFGVTVQLAVLSVAQPSPVH